MGNNYFYRIILDGNDKVAQGRKGIN